MFVSEPDGFWRTGSDVAYVVMWRAVDEEGDIFAVSGAVFACRTFAQCATTGDFHSNLPGVVTLYVYLWWWFEDKTPHCRWGFGYGLTWSDVPLQGAELPMKELDSLLHLLGERKRKLEQEEAESNMDVLLDFLHLSRQRKQEELQEVRHWGHILNLKFEVSLGGFHWTDTWLEFWFFFFQQLQGDLHFLKEDIATVERRRQDLLRAKKKFAKRARMMAAEESSPNLDTHAGGAVSVWRGGQGGAFAPPSEPKSNLTKNMAFSPLVKKDGPVPIIAKFLENPFLDPRAEATGVHTVSKKRRVLAQVCIEFPNRKVIPCS
jgi:hypothetical protein